MVSYLLAAGAAAAAVALRWLVDPWLGHHFGLVTVFPAIAVTVWHGGYRPAIVAAGLGYVACDYLLPGSPGAAEPAALRAVALSTYLLSSGIVIAAGEVLRRGQHRIGERQSLLLVTLGSIGDAVMTTDPEGKVTYLNPVAESLTGWPLSEAAGRPLEQVFRIVNEQSREAVENPAARALREGVVVGLANHTVLIAKDGTERPIDDSAAPIRDDRGLISGCVLVFRDVTERRRAEVALRRSEQELADFFDNAVVGLHWVGRDGTILRVNQAELDLLGYPREEVVGRNIAEFHADAAVSDDYLTRLLEGETLKDEPAQLRRKDGSVRDVLISSSALFREGRFVHSRCFMVDVTDRKKADEVRALLAGIVSASDDAIISKTLDGTIRTWNAGAEQLFGYTEAEAIGQPIDLIVPPELRDDERALLERLRRGEHVDHFETVRVAKGGRRIDISLAISPLKDDAGRTIGASKVARDIGDRKRSAQALKESEERFARFMQHLPGLAWIKDLDGRYVFANAAAEQAFRTAREALYGRTDDDVFPPDVAARFKENDLQALSGNTGVQVVETLEHDDGLHHSIVSKFPILGPEGRPALVGGIAVDITERKRAEEALREADRRKDEFLAILAHELRNPLAPISNSLELLRRSDWDPSVVHQARETMERQLAHLVRLVDDLLDVSRITHGRIELRKARVALQGVVKQAVETCRPFIERARQSLEVTLPETPVYLEADASRLSQVFSNLLDNASKYTLPGGSISLTTERQGADVVVYVRDTGVGIPQDQLTTIFEMFAQAAPAPERSGSGLGIGLTLARRLIELHGGRVLARSEGPGRGSEFVVRLPVLDEVVGVPAPEAGRFPAGLGAGLHVLVVDDNPDSADSLALLLTLSGHQATVVQDGLEAVAAAGRLQPDVVLLDLGLPKLDGFEACRRIRAQSPGMRPAIVALTGWGQEEDRRKTKAAGFDHHLVKPVDYDALLQLLGSLLSGGVS